MKKVNLSRHKFHTLFTAGTISFGVSTIVGFLDNIVSDYFLGESVIIEGLIISALFLIFGDFVCVVYAITTPALVDMANVAICCDSIFIVFVFIIYLYVGLLL